MRKLLNGCMALLTFGLTYSAVYDARVAQLNRLSTSLYGNAGEQYTFSKAPSFYALREQLPDGAILYEKLLADSDVRAVLLGSTRDTPTLRSGRFFSAEDFSTDQAHVAVVGKDVVCTGSGADTYVVVDGQQYRVIGIMGYDQPSRIDRTTLLSANADNLCAGLPYVLNGGTKEEQNSLWGNEELFGELVDYRPVEESILNVVDATSSKTVTTALFILILGLDSVLILISWAWFHLQEITVWRMNGFLNRQIFARLQNGCCTFLCRPSRSALRQRYG